MTEEITYNKQGKDVEIIGIARLLGILLDTSTNERILPHEQH